MSMHTCSSERTHFAPSSSAFCSLPSAQRSRNLTEASQREGRGFDLFFPVIPSFQIKGRFVFKLTKSSGGPRQRANIVKCLSRSICVMAELSVTVCTRVCVCRCTDLLLPPLHPPPFWATRFQQSRQTSILELIIIVSLLSHSIMDEPSKVQDSGFPSTVPPCFKWSFCS